MITRFVTALSLLAAVACQSEQQPAIKAGPAAPSSSARPRPDPLPRAVSPAEAAPTADELARRLQPIRANYQQLNAVRRWDKVVRRERHNSTDGGEAAYYYQAGRLAKVVTHDYGETGQWLTEYYLLPDQQLSFVYEKTYDYNRPYYQDSAQAQVMGDSVVFDLAKSRIEETRSYFVQGRLIRQLGNPVGGSAPPNKARQAEQKRLLADFNELLHLLNQPR